LNTVSEQINFNDLIQFVPNHVHCGIEMVEAYADSNYNQLAKS